MVELISSTTCVDGRLYNIIWGDQTDLKINPNQLLHTSTLRGGGMYISELFLFTLDISCIFIIHQSGVNLGSFTYHHPHAVGGCKYIYIYIKIIINTCIYLNFVKSFTYHHPRAVEGCKYIYNLVNMCVKKLYPVCFMLWESCQWMFYNPPLGWDVNRICSLEKCYYILRKSSKEGVGCWILFNLICLMN